MSALASPIFVKSIIVGDRFHEASLERALNTRSSKCHLPHPYRAHPYLILPSHCVFIDGLVSKSGGECVVKPSPLCKTLY